MRIDMLVAVLIMSSVLTSCTDTRPEQSSLKTPLLLWHVWSERDTEVLDELLMKFNAIYPDVDVIQRRLPEQDFIPELLANNRLGLGPDVVIAHSRYIRQLVDAGAIQPFPTHDLDLSLYFSTALKTVRYGEELFGIPLSLHTQALYYNTTLVKEPPETLQQMLEQASVETPVALNTGFYEALWGIQAFGGQVFDDEGRTILNQGGFANWLGWLKKAQNVSGILLNTDRKTLHTLFLQGRIAYYTAGSEVLQEVLDTLGEGVVGAIPLPAGPNNPSGPALETEAFLISSHTSSRQAALAVQLAKFFTTFEQQNELTRQLKRVPANSRVWVDPRVYPAVSGFAAQSRTAVALPNMPQTDTVRQYGNDAYIQTLAGVLEPQVAAQRLTEQVNTAYGFESVPEPVLAACNLQGAITLWFLPQELDPSVLETMREHFQARCPAVTIQLHPQELAETEADMDSQVYELYREAVAQGTGPDLLIGSNHLTALLAADKVLQTLDTLVEPEFLQRYLPEVLQTVTSEGKLYALPLSIIELMALYYNADLVVDPPLSLEDLLNQADEGRHVVLPINFYYAYWGLPVFGVRLFDAEYRVVLDDGGFYKWLNWLRQASKHPNMHLVNTLDIQELQQPFIDGRAAYFAGEIRQLSALQTALGTERLRVIPLPAGKQGRSGPILGTLGMMLNAESPQAQQRVALTFARDLAGIENQTVLMKKANQVPANVNVDTTEFPAIDGFLEQARTASVPPIVQQVEQVFYWGHSAYYNVLELDMDIAAVVRNFVDLANKANGFQLPAPSPACPQVDTLTLWHSWEPPFSDALGMLTAGFSKVCPNVTVLTSFLPEVDMPVRLSGAVEDGTAPDLILTSHMQLNALIDADVLRDIRPLVDDRVLLRYHSVPLSAVQAGGALYGLPLDSRISVLLYRRDLVDNISMLTIDDLLALATPDTPVALDSRFSALYWGISVFGGRFFNEAGELAFDEGGFMEWLTWLKEAGQHQHVVFSDSTSELLKLFTDRKVACLIADSSLLPSLRDAFEPKQVGVAVLPVGPHGDPPMPLLHVNAFMFPVGRTDERISAALELAKFITSDAGQTSLMRDTSTIPTNQFTIVSIDDPEIADVQQLVDYAIILSGTETIQRLYNTGTQVYADVVSGVLPPDEAIAILKQKLEHEPEEQSDTGETP